ncbi:hypothetical protein J6590_099713 [Homalodisca vitripennis]|nr:hypothetical protein J6590_099713 [Homalodisca vitripennis]
MKMDSVQVILLGKAKKHKTNQAVNPAAFHTPSLKFPLDFMVTGPGGDNVNDSGNANDGVASSDVC